MIRMIFNIQFYVFSLKVKIMQFSQNVSVSWEMHFYEKKTC